jgi:cellobiose-specific phosphotransferase system component IIA
MQPIRREKMIENGLILTGNDAESMSQALEKIKAQAYEESETSLNDTQVQNALVSCFRAAAKTVSEKEACRIDNNPLSKYLVLGT